MPYSPSHLTASSSDHLIRHRRKRTLVASAMVAVVASLLLVPGVAQASTGNFYDTTACSPTGTMEWTVSTLNVTGDAGGCGAQGDAIYAGTTEPLMTPIAEMGNFATVTDHAPANESIVGLGYTTGDFGASDDWGTGWLASIGSGGLAAANDPVDDALMDPGANDCFAADQTSFDNSQTSGCGVTVYNGWYGGLDDSAVALAAQCRGNLTTCEKPNDDITAAVIDPVTEFNDPNMVPGAESPTGGLASGGVMGAGWISGAGLTNESASVTAYDPAGICTLTVELVNAAGTVVATSADAGSGTGNWTGTKWIDPDQDGPCTTSSQVAAESSSTDEEPAATATLSGVNLSTLPTGTYTLQYTAQNPGDIHPSAHSSLGTDPGVVTLGTIEVDNTTPTVNLSSSASSGSWYTTSTAPKVSITTTDTDTPTANLSDSNTGPGVASISCTTNGTQVSGSPFSGSSATLPASAWAAQGANTVTCNATSVGGRKSTSSTEGSYTLDIDNATPSTSFGGATAAPAVYGSAPSVTVTGSETDSSGTDKTSTAILADGLSGISGSSCTITNDSTTTKVNVSEGGTIPTKDLGDGVNEISCYSTTNAGNTNQASPATETIDIESTPPTVNLTGASASPSASQLVWNSGQSVVTVTATGSMPAGPDQQFGVSSVSCAMGSASAITQTGTTGNFTVPDTGVTTVSCYATNTAGIRSATVTELVAVDDTSPQLGGIDITSNNVYNGWSRTPQTAAITFSTNGGSNMQSIACTLTPATGTGGEAQTVTFDADGTITPANGTSELTNPSAATSGQDSTGNQETATITVQPPGGTLVCTGTNQAGNISKAGTDQLNIDNQPPTGYLLPEDPTNPALIQAQLADAGSGVNGTASYIEIYAENDKGQYGWNELQSTYNAQTGVISATVPDDGVLADNPVSGKYAGGWPVAVVAVDNVGNVGNSTDTSNQNITTLQDGTTPYLVNLPLRTPTEITASASANGQTVTATQDSGVITPPVSAAAVISDTARVKRLRDAIGSTTCPTTRDLAVRTITTRRVTVQKRMVRSTALAYRCVTAANRRIRRATVLQLRYGQRSRLTGTLRRVDGAVIPHARVEIVQVPELPTASSRVLTTVRTNSHGEFNYMVPAGPSRTLALYYHGTQVLRTSASRLREDTAGSLSIKAPARIVAGRRVTLTAVLHGGFVSSGGALVQFQYHEVGTVGGFAPFGPIIRTNSHGTGELTFPFTTAGRGLSFEFRVVVPNENSDYGYSNPDQQYAAVSRVLRRKIK